MGVFLTGCRRVDTEKLNIYVRHGMRIRLRVYMDICMLYCACVLDLFVIRGRKSTSVPTAMERRGAVWGGSAQCLGGRARGGQTRPQEQCSKPGCCFRIVTPLPHRHAGVAAPLQCAENAVAAGCFPIGMAAASGARPYAVIDTGATGNPLARCRDVSRYNRAVHAAYRYRTATASSL